MEKYQRTQEAQVKQTWITAPRTTRCRILNEVARLMKTIKRPHLSTPSYTAFISSWRERFQTWCWWYLEAYLSLLLVAVSLIRALWFSLNSPLHQDPVSRSSHGAVVPWPKNRLLVLQRFFATSLYIWAWSQSENISYMYFSYLIFSEFITKKTQLSNDPVTEPFDISKVVWTIFNHFMMLCFSFFDVYRSFWFPATNQLGKMKKLIITVTFITYKYHRPLK